MKMAPILILGNGGAAVHAIKALRNGGYIGAICQICDVEGPAFNPMLAPYYLKGKISWENCYPFGNSIYQKYDVDCHFGSPVQSLDAGNKAVFLKNGRCFSYEKCLVATGASPVIPPVPGLKDSPLAFPVRTARSTLNIESAIVTAEKIVVLGASLVGVKLAEILKRKDKQVILLDVASQMMPLGAHPLTAGFLEDYFSRNGIDVRLGCTLKGLEGAPRGVSCHFPDSIIEEADFVSVCTGIRPNLHFIDPAQVAVGQAILVDERMHTSAEGLYAAGDVCQGMNRLSGEKEWMGTWGNACYQGRTAGYNMAGVHAEYPGSIPQHVSPFFDWTYIQMGDVNGKGETIRVVTEGNPFEGAYRLMVFDNDILAGVNLINCSEGIGEMKKAITQKLRWN
jgi:NADPH-dependent 2,4-dienoyl-CoA reductase/sulfur reductase-like enzyme